MAAKVGTGTVGVYEIVEAGDENGIGEVLKRVTMLSARGSDEADRIYRDRLAEEWPEDTERVEYRCIPMSAVGYVYEAEQEQRVRGGRRR